MKSKVKCKTKTKTIIKMFLLMQLVISGILFITTTQTNPQIISIEEHTTFPIEDSSSNIKTSAVNYDNITVISDGFAGVWGWNTGYSESPEIAVDDGSGNIHAVWRDHTPGIWGVGGTSDPEIMYAHYTAATGQWSHFTVISDLYQGSEWNTGDSTDPDIVMDGSGNLHVVWSDESPGKWGGGASDSEIMYVNYTAVTHQWSNITVISDLYQGSEWNTGDSTDPEIGVDGSGNLHVVWSDGTPGIWGVGGLSDQEIMYANYTAATGLWSNITVISDGFGGVYWNTEGSHAPDIAVDGPGDLHVVWSDYTHGAWRDSISDPEIMYANYTAATGLWSNITVISDGFGGVYWNTGYSESPDIDMDGPGNLHVVWADNSPGVWGSDSEIMYARYTATTGQWSNITVISDGFGGKYWNTGYSIQTKIAADVSGNLHAVWQDRTPGVWGMGGSNEPEIMYAKYTAATSQWSNITVISDGFGGKYWNTGYREAPDIAVDGSGNFHVVWSDESPGKWGGGTSDPEIMYTKIIIPSGDGSNVGDDDDDDDGDDKIDLTGIITISVISSVVGIVGVTSVVLYVKKKGYYNIKTTLIDGKIKRHNTKINELTKKRSQIENKQKSRKI